MLRPSTQDEIALTEAITNRFLQCCDEYLRIRGVKLLVPSDLQRDFIRWRQAAVRYKSGDFRTDNDEVKSARIVAQWTLDVHRQLCNQPAMTLEWSDLPR